MRLYPRGGVRKGEPKGALGRLTQCKEIHLCCAKPFTNLSLHPTVQHPFPWSELLSRQKVCRYVHDPWDMDRSQGWHFFPVPKGEVVAYACLVCVTGSLSGNRCITQPPYCPSWWWHESVPGTEVNESHINCSHFQAVYVPDEVLACPDTTNRPALEDRTPSWEGSIHHNQLVMADNSHFHSFLEKFGVPPHWEGTR